MMFAMQVPVVCKNRFPRVSERENTIRTAKGKETAQ